MFGLKPTKKLPTLTDDEVSVLLGALADATWPIATATYRGATDEHRRDAIENAIDILETAKLITRA